MTIYGEYLFIENFMTGIIILFFTGKILGAKMKPFSTLLCGSCCGLYAFVLFLPLNGIFSWVCKAVFSLLVIFLAFGVRSWKRLVRGGIVFLGVTVFYGGTTIAIITSFRWTSVTAAAGVYLPPLTYITVTAAATAAALFLWILLEILKTRRIEKRRFMETEVIIGDRRWTMKGLIDSGNDLKEPITGRPVSIMDWTQGRKIIEAVEDGASRFTLIPYRGVGVVQGVMEGFRVDRICLDDGTAIYGAIIALCEEEHFRGREDGMDILLPVSLLERGIYGDF